MPETTGVGTLTELKSAFEAKKTIIREGMDKGINVDGANVELSPETAAIITKAHEDAQQIMSYIRMYTIGEDPETKVDINPAQGSVAMGNQHVNPNFPMQQKSIGELVTECDEFKQMVKRRDYRMTNPLDIEVYDLGSMGRKDVFNAMTPQTIVHGFGRIQFDPMVPRGQRRQRVRDLFPQAATAANLIDFFRVLGYVGGDPGQAASVPDYSGGAFGLKPHSQLNFEPAQAPVRTLAHWEAAHRNALDDEPALQATINNELLYGLALVEDDQILNGDGTGENLLGILQTSNIQTYTAPALELRSDSLRKAATLSVLANYPSNGYVLHPNDWEAVELQKAASGVGGNDQQYSLTTNIAIGLQVQVWRQPVVETPAIDEGVFLTGAFGTGAQLYDRQLSNIRIADQHADFFVRNAVVILCEERLALATKRPESFVKGTFLP